MRIKVSRATEDLGGDLILLDRNSRILETVLRKVTQQSAERFRPVQHPTLRQTVNGSEILARSIADAVTLM